MEPKRTWLTENFNEPGHTKENIRVIAIEKTTDVLMSQGQGKLAMEGTGMEGTGMEGTGMEGTGCFLGTRSHPVFSGQW
ncbi:hypothetical protein ACOMHN_029785 [Nucella lapillus]